MTLLLAAMMGYIVGIVIFSLIFNRKLNENIPQRIIDVLVFGFTLYFCGVIKP